MSVDMLEGLIAIIPTPFLEYGAVGEAGVRHLVRAAVDRGLDGVVVLGSNAEFLRGWEDGFHPLGGGVAVRGDGVYHGGTEDAEAGRDLKDGRDLRERRALSALGGFGAAGGLRWIG